MKKIYVENDYDGLYSRYWRELGEIVTREAFLRNPAGCNLVAFTGGDDVSPELYKHKNLRSFNSPARDKREVRIFELAQDHGIPLTGICRGSQFLNVMLGGTLVQHLGASHGGSPHQMVTSEGRHFPITSSHHQMSILGPGGMLIGWSERAVPLSSLVWDGIQEDLLDALTLSGNAEAGEQIQVTEAFVYPEQKAFGCQFHAEWMKPSDEAWQWQLEMTRKTCFGE